jgi:imidazoleglycerol-phosphate dehydratase
MTLESCSRLGTVVRKTLETDIQLRLELDGTGQRNIDTGVPFLDHMLTLFAVHGSFDLNVYARGDIEVDDHHSVEDIGICLGQAVAEALGDKSGINRYGSCYLPMDETLARVVLDLSNRPYLHFGVTFPEQKIGTFDSCLAKEFFRAVAQHGGITMHVDLLHGENGHHIIEAIFKGFARALRDAVGLRGITAVLSSKGSL